MVTEGLVRLILGRGPQHVRGFRGLSGGHNMAMLWTILIVILIVLLVLFILGRVR